MWWYVVVFVVSLIIAVSTMPKPQSRRPDAFEDIDAPTAEEGREIPVLFGTRMIEGPNLVWYGDFKSSPIQR
jgi:hypothetical protein